MISTDERTSIQARTRCHRTLAGRSGHVFVALSTSGNSGNLVRATGAARQLQVQTLALLGGDGGRLHAEADLALVVPSKSIARIQESHAAIGHILCYLVERMLAEPGNR